MLAGVLEKLAERLGEVPGLQVQGAVPAAPPFSLPTAVISIRRVSFPPPERKPVDVQVAVAVVASSVAELAATIDNIVEALSAPWRSSPIRGVGSIVVQGMSALEGHPTGVVAELSIELFVV